jgi:serine/threonine protein kinase
LLDEKVDIFSLGSIFFSLLTGLIPFDEILDDEKMMENFKRGETPFIDPRYRHRHPVESGFVDIIQDCWKFRPDDRPSAADVAQRLKKLSRQM